MNISFSLDVWGMIVGIVVAVVWLVRLEAKGNANEKENVRLEAKIDKLEEQSAERENAVWQKLEDLNDTMTEILQKLSRIEGKLENKND